MLEAAHSWGDYLLKKEIRIFLRHIATATFQMQWWLCRQNFELQSSNFILNCANLRAKLPEAVKLAIKTSKNMLTLNLQR